tara:strand:+ start:200 stop:376 length:177 start_codon:yes stop_codon:yes gene_type:complete
MSDLKNVIEQVLKSVRPGLNLYGDQTGSHFVSIEDCQQLQSEYNIHFVEPNEKQLEIL